jgi:hypothetical protein
MRGCGEVGLHALQARDAAHVKAGGRLTRVNEVEAAEVADARLGRLRAVGYRRLVEQWLGQPRSEYATAPSGRQYQLEIEAVWDDKPYEDLRMWVLIDDGTKATERRPLQRDFIMRPDGSFVGE